jgi:CDP-diacylglycerol---serine O-phosphatidyltransferase
MLGFYNYTVWLTYGSLISAVIGIFVSLAGHGHPYIGAIFLLVSGLCDAFDGMVARTKADRSEQEKQYGIQIDSLSDLAAFGVLPACIGAALYKASSTFDPPQEPCLVARVPYAVFVGIFVLYVLAALIRLAFFNVQAEAGCAAGEKMQKVYYGLPVTSAALIFPTFLLLRYLICVDISIGYYAIMLLTSVAFVCKFRMHKPTLRTILILVGIGGIEFLLILLLKVNVFR